MSRLLYLALDSSRHEILPCCETTKHCQMKRFKNRQTTMKTIEHLKFKGWIWNPTVVEGAANLGCARGCNAMPLLHHGIIYHPLHPSFRQVGWTVSWEFCRGISFTPPAIELVGPSSDQSLVMKKFDTSSRWFLTHDHIDSIDAKSRWDGKNWCHQHLG